MGENIFLVGEQSYLGTWQVSFTWKWRCTVSHNVFLNIDWSRLAHDDISNFIPIVGATKLHQHFNWGRSKRYQLQIHYQGKRKGKYTQTIDLTILYHIIGYLGRWRQQESWFVQIVQIQWQDGSGERQWVWISSWKAYCVYQRERFT